MSKSAIELYRPVKSADGQGGSEEALTLTRTIFGSIVVHEGETSIVGVDIDEDVDIGDILKVLY